VKIAVVGSGGREHAILWRLAREEAAHELFACPGNGGTSALATNVEVDVADTADLAGTVCRLAPDLAVIGPEAPLADGIADALQRKGIACFGPSAAAARIESSKVFAKRLMQRHSVPTADFRVFEDYSALERFVRTAPENGGWVVKADGLAAGKGAYVCSNTDETLRWARALLIEGVLGTSGQKVVLERRLYGREVSALFFCDGERFLALPAAQDYKRAEDGDRGMNTGGMGSFCPAPHLTPELLDLVCSRIVGPVIRALGGEGSPYRGILYAGLMITDDGPQVIEFNCRFGDPESQVILPVWQGNFADVMLACATGTLQNPLDDLANADGAAVCVVLAAEGYPGSYVKHVPLIEVPDSRTAFTLHAGTRRTAEGLVSSGGRVLNAIGLGASVADAREQAYGLTERLKTRGLRFRRDIAHGV
jgi:phosphoribosylamine--glycine ligase